MNGESGVGPAKRREAISHFVGGKLNFKLSCPDVGGIGRHRSEDSVRVVAEISGFHEPT